MLIIQCPWIRQSFHSNSFSVRWVLEEVGIVVMLIVQLCNLLKDILPGTEVLDYCEC